jgi:ABC-type Fe3+/spermidine/putrescine transport system ATPase subunit
VRLDLFHRQRDEPAAEPFERSLRQSSSIAILAPALAGFIGRANFVPGIVRSVDPGSERLVVDALTRQLVLGGVREQHTEDTEVTLIVCPEMIEILDKAAVEGVVWRVSYLGDTIDYAHETDPTRMMIYPVDSVVGLSFNEDCICVLP